MTAELKKEEIVDLINKCWMTHDGMWFYHSLAESGIEVTNRLNKAAIKSLVKVEIPRILETLSLSLPENYDEFRDFFKKASEYMIPDFMNVTFSFPCENIMEWEFTKDKCFAYKGIKRLCVLDEYECGALYRIKCWLDELEINHRFSPEIGSCHMHNKGECRGRVELFI